jgi:hypothetical protein
MTVGLDLGQLQDYSAVCVLESVEEFTTVEEVQKDGTVREVERMYFDHRVVHLERFPLGTQYGAITEKVARIYEDANRRLHNPGLARGFRPS